MMERTIDPVLAEIKKRGHWESMVRPTSFSKQRIERVKELEPFLEAVQVRMSGWYFPHLDRNDPPKIKGDYIEQAGSFEDLVEFFRFYQSGQFAYFRGFIEDWQERARLFRRPGFPLEPGKVLGVGSVIYYVTHVFELAARMAQRLPSDDDLQVEVAAVGLVDRILVVDSPRRMPFIQDYRAHVPQFRDLRRWSRTDLIARPRELAAGSCARLFEQFGWNPDLSQIAGSQAEMFPPQG